MAEQQLSPDAPATERQRQMLKIAIAKEALFPNPFSGQYEKWENLTAGEADKLLSTGVSMDKNSDEYKIVMEQLKNPVFYSVCGNFLDEVE